MTNIHTTNCPVCGNEDLQLSCKCKDHFATGEIFSIQQCKQCNFAFTQDFPSEEGIGKYYEVPSYISHSDTNQGFINKLYHWARKVSLNSKSKIVLKYSEKHSGILLDVGCGTGYFLNRMKQLKWVVTGIEKSDSAKAYAKSKFDLGIQEPEYLYEVQAESKDVITMWHVLEHIEPLNKCVKQLHKILREDGLAIIALPNKSSYDAQSYKENWAAFDVPRHLWHFSPDDFELFAQQNGFELIDLKPMLFDAFYISMLSEKNKGTTFPNLVGLTKGSLYFFRSLFNKKKSSSLIYILKKKNS